jgi:hypothetical protein
MASISLVFVNTFAFAAVTIPDDTMVYLTTTETVIGKKDQATVGQIVPARVWRDVIVDGQIVIKGGTPATTKISSLKTRKIFGIQGKMSLAAIETKTVDGQTVYLTGGYNKEGGGRMLVSLGVGVLLFWPALFVVGKAAELPTGTVMDSFTVGAMTVDLPDEKKAMQSINLGSIMSGLSVEVLYEKLKDEKKPKYFDFLITTDTDVPPAFQIDVVNGEEIEPLPLEVLSTESSDEEQSTFARVKIKPLIKTFKKGINTFEISCVIEDERVAEEVILQIEI